jgi:hypothetical protein
MRWVGKKSWRIQTTDENKYGNKMQLFTSYMIIDIFWVVRAL